MGKQKADFYQEYDLFKCRRNVSKKPEATHQKETINKLKKWFETEKFPSGAIVALPTGSGKTFTAVRFLCKNVIAKDYKVLWLAHTHHLLEQAFYSFGPLTESSPEGYEVGWIPEPMETLKVRVVSGAPNQFNINQIKPDDNIIIATLQSIANAYKNRHPQLEDFLKSAHGKLFIVFDEAHHAPAPSYRNLILNMRKRFKKMHLMGLTATPTTTDMKKRGWFSVLFPQKIIHQTSMEKLMAEGILAKPIIEEAETDVVPEFDERQYLKWDDNKSEIPQPVITKLAKNIPRNKRIVETYLRNKDKYRKTIIFADRWYQCDSINTLLNSQGISSDVMYHQMGNERNSHILEKFKNNQLDVIVNIKMLTEGTDVPDLDTVFVTRQTTSTILMTQMVGRALRGPKFGGKHDANLVFFHDDWDKTINWAIWDTESWESIKIGNPQPITGKIKEPVEISQKEVTRLLNMMDSNINVNPGPFLTFMPLGWFKITVAEINDDGNPEEIDRLVMVFENEYNNYLQLIEHLQKENLKVFDDEKVEFEAHKDRIKDWSEIFFSGTEKYVGDITKNIFSIARHLAQNRNESPQFIQFEERKYHDLDAIARKYIDLDYGHAIERQKLSTEYHKDDRYWKVIYYNYELFKFQYNACVEWILNQDNGYYKPIINKENKLIQKLKKGTVEEKISAIEVLGDMGLEETIHEETLQLIENIAAKDDDIKVRKAAQCVVDLIKKLYLTVEDKKKIKDRDNYRCLCCGEDTKRYLEVDHIKPRYYEVDNSEDNLQTLCKICNITKSTKTIDFRKKITPLKEAPIEFPGLDKIENLDKWSVRDLKWWNKFLKRNINFFYECNAVNSLQLKDMEWNISLYDNNPPLWFKQYLEELTEKINLIRKEHGYIGPQQISIYKKEPEDCEKLIKELKNTRGRNKKRVVTKLGNMGCEKAVNPLIRVLEDSSTFATPAAAAALAKIGDPKAVKPLIRMLSRKKSLFRQAAKRALIKIGPPATEDLINALDNRNIYVRKLSAEALGTICDEEAVDELIESLNDEESVVRWRAAKALGQIGDTRAIKSLKQSSKDPNIKVREEAQESLLLLQKKVEKLFEEFEGKFLDLDDRIIKKPTQSGYSYFSPQRAFFSAYLYDPSKVTFHAKIGKQEFEGSKRLKDKNKVSYVAYNEKDFSRALKLAKKSLENVRLESGEKL